MKQIKYVVYSFLTGVTILTVLFIIGNINTNNSGDPDEDIPFEKISKSVSATNDKLKQVDILQNALEKYPNSDMLHIRLSEVYLSNGDAQKAEAELKNVIDSFKLEFYYRIYGNLYVFKGNFIKAKEMLDQAISLVENDSNRAHIYFSYANMYNGMKDREKALQNAKNAVKLLPRQEFKEFVKLLEAKKNVPK